MTRCQSRFFDKLTRLGISHGVKRLDSTSHQKPKRNDSFQSWINILHNRMEQKKPFSIFVEGIIMVSHGRSRPTSTLV